ALQTLFYTVLSILFLAAGYLFALRVKNWSRGLPDDRSTTRKNFQRRVRDFRAGVYMQTLLRDPAAGLMHSLMYFGFIGLFIVTLVSQIQHSVPRSWKFLHGQTYQAYAAFSDAVGIMFLAGVVWAVGRRYVQHPYRIRIKTRPEDAVILLTFLVLGVSGFVTEALRIADRGHPHFERWSFIGYPFSLAFHGQHLGWYRAVWVLHVAGFALFLLLLPTTKLRHMFTSPRTMYLSDRQRPKGAMRPMPNLMETELE